MLALVGIFIYRRALRYNIGMKKRLAKEYESLEQPVTLSIHTKSPQKWLLLDRETGQAYEGNSGGYWDKLAAKPTRLDQPDQDI